MILFITRKFPPSVGGMQQLSYDLTRALSRKAPTKIIRWGRSQRWLPVFIVYALVRGLWILMTREVDAVHLGDPVLSPLGVVLRLLGRRPVVVNAHGLDVIYPSKLYQSVIAACMRQLDFVICISEHTRQLCLTRDIQSERTTVIPVGVDTDRFSLSLGEDDQRHWRDRWGLTSPSNHILITVGRLVPRKGVLFLVSEVLPELARLRDDWVYLVVGDGPERGRIEDAVQNHGLENRTRILGRVSAEELRAVYAMASLFVMPNVPVAGDTEGFGMVTLEARAAGLPVVAASLGGIGDSFESSDDGTLLPPGEAEPFAHAINQWLETRLTDETRLRRRHRVEGRFGWSRIAQEYLAVFHDVAARYRVQQNAETIETDEDPV